MTSPRCLDCQVEKYSGSHSRQTGRKWKMSVVLPAIALRERPGSLKARR